MQAGGSGVSVSGSKLLQVLILKSPGVAHNPKAAVEKCEIDFSMIRSIAVEHRILAFGNQAGPREPAAFLGCKDKVLMV